MQGRDVGMRSYAKVNTLKVATYFTAGPLTLSVNLQLVLSFSLLKWSLRILKSLYFTGLRQRLGFRPVRTLFDIKFIKYTLYYTLLILYGEL